MKIIKKYEPQKVFKKRANMLGNVKQTAAIHTLSCANKKRSQARVAIAVQFEMKVRLKYTGNSNILKMRNPQNN